MARVAGATSRVYLDEFNLSGLSNAFDLSIDVDVPDVTAFSDAAKTAVEGKHGVACTINCFNDLADDSLDEQAFAILGEAGQNYVGLYPGSTAAAGSIGYEMVVDPKTQPRRSEVAGAILMHLEFQGDSVVRSTVLANGAVTGTGVVSGSNLQVGATTAGQVFVAVLRVLSVSGSGSITVKVQESSDDGAVDTYADLLTFTAATAIGVERKSTTAATEAWKRVNVSAYATFTSVTLMVAVGREY